MVNIGIVKAMNEYGQIVIPQEIRRKLNLISGDRAVVIYFDDINNAMYIKKYEDTGEI